MSMSLDGFIEDASGGVDALFGWYAGGAEVVAMPGDDREFRTSQASADHMRATIAATGALVCGRRLFDLTRAWGGRHPAGVSVFVVTHRVPDNWAHPDAPFTSSPTG